MTKLEIQRRDEFCEFANSLKPEKAKEILWSMCNDLNMVKEVARFLQNMGYMEPGKLKALVDEER